MCTAAVASCRIERIPLESLIVCWLMILANIAQNLTELFHRMDEEIKKVVQEVLRVLHRHFAGYPEVREQNLTPVCIMIM